MSNSMSQQKANPYTLGEIEQGAPCCVPQAVLQVRDLAVSYGEKTVLSQVSLDIYKGCITALIGPSGCGKTSFLTTLNRLTDQQAHAQVSGQILFDGQDLLRDPIDTLRLRRRIGMIFQRPNPFPLSIWRNLDLPLKEHGVKERRVRAQKIEQALRDVGLWNEISDRLDSSALALSGGQQQRVACARAMITKPHVVFADEPTGALDSKSGANLLGYLRHCVDDLGQTIIMVTHDAKAASYADRTLMLLDGRIVDDIASPTAESVSEAMAGLEG